MCGLSTRKMRTPCAIQNSNTPASASHSSRQCVGLEVERIDVLVLLRRVLGVLDRCRRRACGTTPGARARTDGRARTGTRCRARSRCRARRPAAPGAGSRPACRARRGSASWPPSAAPIAHGLPTSSGAASSVLLRPLRRSRPIGWIGGKYSTSKPMPRDVRQPRLAVGEGAVPRRVVRRRAREELVPARKARALAIDRQRKSVRRGPHAAGRDGVQRSPRAPRRAPSAFSASASAACGERVEQLVRPRRAAAWRRGPLRARCAACSISVGAAARGDAQIVDVDAALEVVAPRQERIDPGAHGVAASARARSTTKLRRASGRCRAAPSRVARHSASPSAPQQRAGDDVVAVGEAVGLDADHVADDALDREAAAVDARRDVLDDDAHAAVGARRSARPRCLALSDPRPVVLAASAGASGGRRRFSAWKRPCAATGTLLAPPSCRRRCRRRAWRRCSGARASGRRAARRAGSCRAAPA